MRPITIVVAALLAAACSSSSGGAGSGPPTLDGSWIYANSDGSAGAGAEFKSDGTYEVQELMVTSSTTVNDQIETGTFTVSGSTITLTPKEWSCPGPDAVYTLTYSFQGSNLTLTQPSGVIVFQPNTAAPASDIAITIGCFSSTGAFTAAPLAAVSN